MWAWQHLARHPYPAFHQNAPGARLIKASGDLPLTLVAPGFGPQTQGAAGIISVRTGVAAARRQIDQRAGNGGSVPMATAAVPIMAWVRLPMDSANPTDQYPGCNGFTAWRRYSFAQKPQSPSWALLLACGSFAQQILDQTILECAMARDGFETWPGRGYRC